MVRKDLHDVTSLGKVVAVLREGMHDSVQLLIVDIPIFLCCMELVMKKEKGMPSVVVLLFKNAGVGFVRGVGGETDRFTRLKRPDVDVVADIGKNAVEGRLMFGSPLPRLVFLGEVGETGRGIG